MLFIHTSKKLTYFFEIFEKLDFIQWLCLFQPTHKYIDFVAKNLGINWKSIFVSLGYLIGRIDTLEMEKGITEV